MIKEACMVNEYAFAEKLKEYLKDVEEEIKLAQKEHLEIRSSDYDISLIVDKQYEICKKYKKKMKSLCEDRKESKKDYDYS